VVYLDETFVIAGENDAVVVADDIIAPSFYRTFSADGACSVFAEYVMDIRQFISSFGLYALFPYGVMGVTIG